MKVFYSFDATAEFNEDLPKIKTNFSVEDTREVEWIAEQCIDNEYSVHDEPLPKTIKLWRKNGDVIGTFDIVIEQRPVLQARLSKDEQPH